MKNRKMRQTEVRCGRFRTSLLEAGCDGSPVLFLIHDGALGADANVSWGGVIAELQSDFHIFAPDLYGFGQSDMLFHFGLRAYQSHVEQIAALIEVLGVDEAHFAGTSYGGSVVLRAAAEMPLPWPMRSGTSIGGTGGLFRHESGKRILAETQPTPESIRRYLELLTSGAWIGIEENAEQRFQNSLRLGHCEVLASPRFVSPVKRLAAREADTYPHSLSQCRVPLLLIEGAKDPLLEHNWASRIAEHAPNARALRFDVSHSPNLDNPALIANVLREFISEHSGPESLPAGPVKDRSVSMDTKDADAI